MKSSFAVSLPYPFYFRWWFFARELEVLICEQSELKWYPLEDSSLHTCPFRLICYVNITLMCFYTLCAFVENKKRTSRPSACFHTFERLQGSSSICRKGYRIHQKRSQLRGKKVQRDKFSHARSFPAICGYKTTEEKSVSDCESLLLMMVGIERQWGSQTSFHESLFKEFQQLVMWDVSRS